MYSNLIFTINDVIRTTTFAINLKNIVSSHYYKLSVIKILKLLKIKN